MAAREAFITCAVTGSGNTTDKSDKVPVTPEQIADDCIAAARAGAAVTHIHALAVDARQGGDAEAASRQGCHPLLLPERRHAGLHR